VDEGLEGVGGAKTERTMGGVTVVMVKRNINTRQAQRQARGRLSKPSTNLKKETEVHRNL